MRVEDELAYHAGLSRSSVWDNSDRYRIWHFHSIYGMSRAHLFSIHLYTHSSLSMAIEMKNRYRRAEETLGEVKGD